MRGIRKPPGPDDMTLPCYCMNDFRVPYNHTFADHEKVRQVEAMKAAKSRSQK